MKPIPVIVGFGGINSAGRTTGHNAYKRLIFDSLPLSEQQYVLDDLRQVMSCRGDTSNLSAEEVLARTCVRQGDAETWKRRLTFPEQLEEQPVSSTAAGFLPDGFDASKLFRSTHYPTAICMGVFSTSEAIASTGLDWHELLKLVPANRINMQMGAGAIGVTDDQGMRGMLSARSSKKRVTSRHMSFSLTDSPGTFVNAYILGQLGQIGFSLGACATFLYNLDIAVRSIRNDEADLAVVGSADCNTQPEIVDSFASMRAMAGDKAICDLQSKLNEPNPDVPDFTRACRPFGENTGMVMGESSQVLILMSDKLAMEVGAIVHGAVGGVHINADGYKKSISAPGPGNYVSMAMCMAELRAILGVETFERQIACIAHGSGTPANRTTESWVVSDAAVALGLDALPVTGVKGRLGHSMGSASGDGIATALGILSHGVIPKIGTTKEIAGDVRDDGLSFALENQHREDGIDGVLVNAKGFGGHNATGSLLSPRWVEQKLAARYPKDDLARASAKRESTQEAAAEKLAAAHAGDYPVVFRYGDPDLDTRPDGKVTLSSAGVEIDGMAKIAFPDQSPYDDAS